MSTSPSNRFLSSLSRPLLNALAVCGLLGAVPAFGDGIRVPPFEAKSAATPAPAGTETAVFAGGCFWGVQGVFQHVKGVNNAVSGYAGGSKQTADYRTVSTGSSGHAESVQVTFDPKQISYAQLLQIYFSVAHDPTEVNRQGPDIGTQYRSAVFPLNDEQARVADAYIVQLDRARVFNARIATKIETGQTFYPAENYHQDFLTLNPRNPYIVVNDLPKIEDLKKMFPALYRNEAALVGKSAKS